MSGLVWFCQGCQGPDADSNNSSNKSCLSLLASACIFCDHVQALWSILSPLLEAGFLSPSLLETQWKYTPTSAPPDSPPAHVQSRSRLSAEPRASHTHTCQLLLPKPAVRFKNSPHRLPKIPGPWLGEENPHQGPGKVRKAAAVMCSKSTGG